MKPLHSGKGANLAEMTDIGLPMPSGFTITTEVCDYDSARGAYPCATVVGHGPSREMEER
jgi:pyruvate,orthophosphate dikinase